MTFHDFPWLSMRFYLLLQQPGNCIFGWLPKSCTSAPQGLHIRLSEGLCIGLTPRTLACQGNHAPAGDRMVQLRSLRQVDPFSGAVHQLGVLRVARCSRSSGCLGGCARGLCIRLTEGSWGLSGWYLCIKAVCKAIGKTSVYRLLGRHLCIRLSVSCS